jgi:hypothetical protein
MGKVMWNIKKKSLPTNVQREFRGVNRIDPYRIDDTFASDLSNVVTSDYPALKTRPGYSLVGTALAVRILGLGVWKDSQLNAISNGQWYAFDGTTWNAVSGGGSLSTSADMSFTNFKGGFTDINLIGTNGTSALRYDGSTVQALTGAPSGINYIETYSNRLFGAVGNNLHFSELQVGTNWTSTIGATSDPGWVPVETNDGELINAVRSGPRRLIAFKPNSIFNVFGDDAENFTLVQVASDIGALSNQCVVNVDGQIYFVHQTGVYVYSGSTRPDRSFSLPVQNYIDRINPTQRHKVCAGSDGINLYIGIPLDDATEPDTLLVYNSDYNTWVVWNGYAPLNLATMVDTPYIGNVDGSVRKVGGLTTDNGVAITGYYTTKVFGAGSYSQKVRWKRAWVVASVPTGSSLSVYMTGNSDGASDFVLVQNIPNNTGVGNTRVIIPTSAAYHSDFITIKFVFSGPIQIIEWSREEDQLPIV